MISVNEALAAIFDLLAPVGTEIVDLRQACGRVLAEDAVANRAQPPFPASAMDGYALREAEVRPGAEFEVIGESAAGKRFSGTVGSGQSVRIFTGAPVPEGADRVIIQEDVIRNGDRILLRDQLDPQSYVRPAGGDFGIGARVAAGRRLGPADISLIASMNVPQLRVYRRPEIAILGTGDELVQPGEDPRPDQIVSSNGFGLAALVEQKGGIARVLPIARDRVQSLRSALDMAARSDLIVTTGGASVGDHDLMASAAEDLGLERQFYRVAMRPGKPLMAGRYHGTPLIGLPGNPVSAMVCGTIFVCPALEVMMGLPARSAPREFARLKQTLGPNGAREHYMRAILQDGHVGAFDKQDSSLQSVLSRANALIVRPPQDCAREIGEVVEVVRI